MNLKIIAVAVATGALAVAGRNQLVDVLTKTTGTWVGVPEPPRSTTPGSR